MKLFATVAVNINDRGDVTVKDVESLVLHYDEEEARFAVKKALLSGDKTAALFTLEGVYEVSTMEFRKIRSND